MKTPALALSISLLVITVMALCYHDGKRDADRWWQKYGCIRSDAVGRFQINNNSDIDFQNAPDECIVGYVKMLSTTALAMKVIQDRADETTNQALQVSHGAVEVADTWRKRAEACEARR